MSLILLVFGLLAFVGLVVIHEFGHFLAARKSDVDVEEFGVGFPPKAVTLTKKTAQNILSTGCHSVALLDLRANMTMLPKKAATVQHA